MNNQPSASSAKRRQSSNPKSTRGLEQSYPNNSRNLGRNPKASKSVKYQAVQADFADTTIASDLQSRTIERPGSRGGFINCQNKENNLTAINPQMQVLKGYVRNIAQYGYSGTTTPKHVDQLFNVPYNSSVAKKTSLLEVQSQHYVGKLLQLQGQLEQKTTYILDLEHRNRKSEADARKTHAENQCLKKLVDVLTRQNYILKKSANLPVSQAPKPGAIVQNLPIQSRSSMPGRRRAESEVTSTLGGTTTSSILQDRIRRIDEQLLNNKRFLV